MFTLGGLYPELRTFFTKHLGVQTLTAKMVYDKLKGSELSLDEARQTIVTFNSFLAGRRHEFDPAPVLKKAVFPVRFPNGEVKLLKGRPISASSIASPLGMTLRPRPRYLTLTWTRHGSSRTLLNGQLCTSEICHGPSRRLPPQTPTRHVGYHYHVARSSAKPELC